MIKIFKKFYKFTEGQRKNFNLSILMSIIHSIFEAMRIPAIAVVLKALIEGNMSYDTVYISLGIMLLSIVGCIITRNSMVMKQAICGYTMCADKRIEIGEHLKYIPMGYFNKKSLGYITSVTTNTVEQIQDVATRVIHLTLQGLITTIIITFMILIFDYRIGIVVIAGIVLFFIANFFMQKESVKLSHTKNYEDSRLVSAILEYIQGISVVKSFNLDKDANKAVNQAIRDSEAITFRMEKRFVPYMGLHNFILKFSSAIVITVSLYFYINNTMSLINCLLMVICSFIIYGQLEAVGSFSSLLRIIGLSIDKVNEIFDTPLMDVDGEHIVPDNYNIKAQNISFSYNNKKVIDNISLNIPQGKTTAIVGPSGGGKSTLCKLISRFWDVDEGAIYIGGRDVRDYTLDSLLSNISMVFQNVYLFNDTIENNIKFGKPNATHDEVVATAKKACCHDFIMEFENGYNTVIGEGGASISGGEKQRISIARALIKDAPIILLDEATANVDPENEEQLQKAIYELTKNKTIIMIAHRLKTIQNAEQILVVDQGEIVQRGTHNELMKQQGIYADFVNIRELAIGWKI